MIDYSQVVSKIDLYIALHVSEKLLLSKVPRTMQSVSRSASTGSQPSCCRVRLLDEGLSVATKRARKLNCFGACLTDLETMGTLSCFPIVSAMERNGIPYSATP